MNEIDAIHNRLDRGEEKFSEVAEALMSIKGHLQSQDQTMAALAAKLDTVVTGTDSIVGMWSGGVKTVRFFCRLAESWTFLLRKVFIPVVLPLTGVWALAQIASHEALPDWLQACIKLILAVL
jgi:hypothetical protein